MVRPSLPARTHTAPLTRTRHRTASHRKALFKLFSFYRLTVYGYWNEGGQANVVEMMLFIASRFFSSTPIPPAPPISTPPTGCLHPDYNGFFATPKQYLAWYAKHGALRGTDAPVAAVLLYRKHVITAQPYIVQLVRQMEAEGVVPVPIFLNGVEVCLACGCMHLHPGAASAAVSLTFVSQRCKLLTGCDLCRLTQL